MQDVSEQSQAECKVYMYMYINLDVHYGVIKMSVVAGIGSDAEPAVSG